MTTTLKNFILNQIRKIGIFILNKMFPYKELPGSHLDFMTTNSLVEKQIQKDLADHHFCFQGKPTHERK